MLFVAIPYLGVELAQRAIFRREYQPLLEDNNFLGGAAERLTAYSIVDGHAKGPFSNSSLSLFEYRFPSEGDTADFNDLEKISHAETKGEPTVVHQVWLAVLNDSLSSTLEYFLFSSHLAPSQIRLRRSGLQMIFNPSTCRCSQHTAKV